MGAQTFVTTGHGKTAKDAFQKAREEAAWESGHGGYTGTIAEKSDFVMINPGNTAGWTRKEYAAWANKLNLDDDRRIADKWGPAGCVKTGSDEWLFFGWASS